MSRYHGPCVSLHAPLQSTIKISKELSISTPGVCLGASFLATDWLVSCGCLEPALLLLVSKHAVIATEAKQRSSSLYASTFTAHRKRRTLRTQSQACRKDEKSQAYLRARWSAPAKPQCPPAKRRTPPHPHLHLPHLVELQSVRIIMPDVMSAILHMLRLPAASLSSVSDHRDLGRQTAVVKCSGWTSTGRCGSWNVLVDSNQSLLGEGVQLHDVGVHRRGPPLVTPGVHRWSACSHNSGVLRKKRGVNVFIEFASDKLAQRGCLHPTTTQGQYRAFRTYRSLR